METIKTFVYGTLKTNEYNNALISTSQFLGKAWVYGELYQVYLPYLFKGNDKVIGEVYEIPKNVYDMIVQMENNAEYYEGNIDAHFENGKVEPCKVFYYSGYGFNKKTAKRILEY